LINNAEDADTIMIAVKDTNAIEALINEMRTQKQLSGGEHLDAIEALVNTAENPTEADTAVEDQHTVETLINTDEDTNVYRDNANLAKDTGAVHCTERSEDYKSFKRQNTYQWL